MNRQLFHMLAKRGAEARMTELEGEIQMLQELVNGQNGHWSAGTKKQPKGPTTSAPATTPRKKPSRGRAKMSAAARKAIGLRMKKYWAERRRAEA